MWKSFLHWLLGCTPDPALRINGVDPYISKCLQCKKFIVRR